MPGETLREFLESVPERSFDGPQAFEQEVVPDLVDRLGYRESNLYFQVALDPQYDLLPDAMVAREKSRRPHLLVEAQYDGLDEDTLDKLTDYGETANAEYVVCITPDELLVERDGSGDFEGYDLADLDDSEVSAAAERLHAPPALPDEPIVERERPVDRTVDADYFTLDLDEYEPLLDRVQDPDGHRKGEALEDLAQLLFDAIGPTESTEQNLYTETSEIDVVARYEGSPEYTLFDEYSRYVLIECKNWQKSIGAKQIRDFKGKLQAAGADLGVFFAQNGVSGGHRGEFALGELDLAFRNDGIAIVIVDGNDLEWVRNGNSFYDLLDRKLYTLRFRRKSPVENL